MENWDQQQRVEGFEDAIQSYENMEVTQILE